MLFAAVALAASQAQQDVTRLDPLQSVENDGKIEVLEFLACGGGHCANLEPAFAGRIKKQPTGVKVRRKPSPVALMGIDSTVTYYLLEAPGQVDRLHAKIFGAAHVQKVVPGNPSALNIWLEKLASTRRNMQKYKNRFRSSPKLTAPDRWSGNTSCMSRRQWW